MLWNTEARCSLRQQPTWKRELWIADMQKLIRTANLASHCSRFETYSFCRFVETIRTDVSKNLVDQDQFLITNLRKRGTAPYLLLTVSRPYLALKTKGGSYITLTTVLLVVIKAILPRNNPSPAPKSNWHHHNDCLSAGVFVLLQRYNPLPSAATKAKNVDRTSAYDLTFPHRMHLYTGSVKRSDLLVLQQVNRLLDA